MSNEEKNNLSAGTEQFAASGFQIEVDAAEIIERAVEATRDKPGVSLKTK